MKTFFLVCMLLLSLKFFPQNQNSIGKCDYIMIVNSNSNFVEFEATLLFNENMSRFIFSNKNKKNDVAENKDDTGKTIINITKRDTTTNIIINNLSKSILYNITENETIFEKNRSQNWILSDEKKVIGNFSCKKATCTFRGRHYTAWFSEEMPLPFGPWKFNGLPGLIIEVFDKTNEVFFTLAKISMPYNIPIININENRETISRDEFIKNNEKSLVEIKEKLEEKARIIETLAGKDQKIKIKVSAPIVKRGIELD